MMNNYVLIAEAIKEVPYAGEHIAHLLREKKVQGKKIGGTWLVDIEDLKAYYERMENLGNKRHKPNWFNPN